MDWHGRKDIILGMYAGAASAGAGAIAVEALISAGMAPLSPAAWPGLFMLLAIAAVGYPGLITGYAVLLGYVATAALNPARFPVFFGHFSTPIVWLVGLLTLGVVTAVLRLRTVRSHERRFSAVTENIGALLTYIDKDERFIFNNRLYEDWYGLPRGDITGRRVKDVLGEAAYLKLEPYVRRALASERVEFDGELLRNGKIRQIHGVYVPDIGMAGRVLVSTAGAHFPRRIRGFSPATH